MRTYWLATAVCLTGCAHPSSSAPSPTGGGRSITGRIIYTSRPDTLPPMDPRVAAAVARLDSINGLADTIVARPDSFLLHVGQSVKTDTLLHIVCYRFSGEPVLGCGQFLDIEDLSIAQFEPAGLTGLKVGRTRMVIKVMGKKAHAPPAYIPVRVMP